MAEVHRKRKRTNLPESTSFIGREFWWLTLDSIATTSFTGINRRAEVTCRCGNKLAVRLCDLIKGRRISCGCYEEPIPETWTCGKCKKTYPFTHDFFSKHKMGKHGFNTYCRWCCCLTVKVGMQKRRLQILRHYSGGKPRCYCCGDETVECLTIDHINNDGKEDRKVRGIGNVLYYAIIREGFPPGLRIACYSCNIARSKDPQGICPHQREREITPDFMI